MRALGPPFTAEESLRFIEAARACLGLRWRHQGRDLRGVDCAGLIGYSVKAAGRDHVDAVGYGRLPYRGKLEEMLRANFGPPLRPSEQQRGDVVLMKFKGAPSHVGILGDYLHGGLSLIHAYAPNGKVIEHGIDAEWRGRITEVYRP